jgi:predicted NBD/HSP70 family sugar kinase
MGYHLGLGISSLINFLNPEAVVVGGSVWRVSDLLLEKVRQTVATNAITTRARHTRIVPSSLGADTAIVGAATLVLEEVFQAPVFQPGSNSEFLTTVPAR